MPNKSPGEPCSGRNSYLGRAGHMQLAQLRMTALRVYGLGVNSSWFRGPRYPQLWRFSFSFKASPFGRGGQIWLRNVPRLRI
jgi:hypothetical protein